MFGIDLKTAGLWALSVAFVTAAATAGVQWVRVADIRADLSAERADRARESEGRSRAALRAVENHANAALAFAAAQQALTHELTEARRAAETADAGRRTLAGRVQELAAELDAARGGGDAEGSCVPGPAGDQCRSLVGLLVEGGQLVARCSAVAAEGAHIVEGRDAEVKALYGENAALRALLAVDGSAGAQAAP